MKKKNGVNIMLFVFIIILFVILSCAKNTKNPPTGILLQTDRDFSAMSVKEGMFKASFRTLLKSCFQVSHFVPERQKFQIRTRSKRL